MDLSTGTFALAERSRVACKQVDYAKRKVAYQISGYDIISQNILEVSELFHTFALPNSNYMDELQNIQNLIYVIRGQRVMLDFDLAMLYEVETRSLNQTVKRNARRFPDDFMFQLTEQEWSLISSQFVMTSRMKRPKKSLPYAFTELGALMLSSVRQGPVPLVPRM